MSATAVPAPAAPSTQDTAVPLLSVVLITKNEEAHIAGCLQSVAFADEVVVLDSGSTDATVAIAKKMGARVEVTADWPGFGAQKNRALDLARGRWVFSIDADERVPPELAAEIQAIVQANTEESSAPRCVAYECARLSMFCGRYMHHSGWRPDYVTRLFLRNSARFSPRLVHESVVLNSDAPQTIGRFQSDLLHLSYHSLDQVLTKMNHYSSARAVDMKAAGRKGGLGRAIGHGLWTFVRGYVFRLGVLDGRHGFVLALYNAHTAYYRYLKMSDDFYLPAGQAPTNGRR